MSFDIPIKIDATGVLPALQKVEDGLNAAERKAKELAKTVRDGMGGAAHGFASVAQAIEMEGRMFERATERAKDFGFHLAAIQRLHAQGKITGDQYIRTLEKMGVAFEHTAAQAAQLRTEQARQAASTIGISAPATPGFGSRAGDFLSGLGGLTTGGALGGALIGLGSQLSEWQDQANALEDRVTEITNRAHKFTTASTDVNAVLSQQHDIALALNSTVAQTIGVYDGIGDATAKLNLSATEQARITETVGKAAQLGGKSMESAADIMQRLSVAFELGADTGGALRTLFTQFPDLAAQLNAGLGATNEEIIQLAKAGKIDFADFARGLMRNTDDLDENFKKITRTHAQFEAQFMEGFERATAAGDSLFAAMQKGADATIPKLKTVAGLGREIQLALRGESRYEGDGSSLDFGLRRSFNGNVAPTAFEGPNAAAFEIARQRKQDVHEAKEQLEGLEIAYRDGATTTELYNEQKKSLLAVIRGTTAEVRKETEALSDYERMFNEIRGPQQDAIRDLNALNQLYMNGRISLEELNEASAKRRDILIELGFLEVKSQTSGLGADAGAGAASFAALPMPSTGGVDMEAFRDNMRVAKQSIEEANEALRQMEIERTREQFEQLGETLRPVGDALIDMFRQGEFSAESLNSALQDVAIQMLKMAALQAIGPGGGGGSAFLRGLLGGRNGFDYLASDAALQLPGFARGGDMTVRGSGSQDSHLAMFRVSAGESIHVRTPQQRMAAEEAGRATRRRSRRGGDGVTVNNIISSDPREVTAALGTYEGRRAVARLDRSAGFARRRSG